MVKAVHRCVMIAQHFNDLVLDDMARPKDPLPQGVRDMVRDMVTDKREWLHTKESKLASLAVEVCYTCECIKNENNRLYFRSVLAQV